jgi:D-beta-D-heptose 7-phosphate kinase/D-beta-D-heptose 1-phosphate adenosyltransferase
MLRKTVGAKAVLVTRSEQGMTLVEVRAKPVHVPAYAVKVLDVSGAGDTVVAVLGVMLAAGGSFEDAMRAANAAASVVVGKPGTATVTAAELRTRILPAASLASEEKIVFDWSVLDVRLAAWRRQALRVGFTNGCFDLLHPGHIKVLTEGLRSPGGGAQRRRLGAPAEGRGAAAAGRASPRRGACRARGGRSRRGV